MEEQWKDIPGYEGFYQASNTGQIKSLYFKPHLLSQGIKSNRKEPHRSDYVVVLSKHGYKQQYLVARLVAMAFLGKQSDKMTVNHINGNTADNSIENLEWVTHRENIQKGFDQGLYKTNCKDCKIISKIDGKIMVFRSQRQASIWMGKSPSYVGIMCAIGVCENEKYYWEVTNGKQ